MFHALLAAFWGQVDDQQVEVEQWDINGARWHAFIGPYGVHGNGDYPVAVPDGPFSTVESLVKARPLEDDLYWVRAYYGHTGGKTVIEVLLNNEVWAEARAGLAGLDWPETSDYYSVRFFLVLRREVDAGR